jgi:hypothetical protein
MAACFEPLSQCSVNTAYPVITIESGKTDAAIAAIAAMQYHNSIQAKLTSLG